jgi:Tol biopolymer transport system component
LRAALQTSDCQFSPDGRWIAYESDESGRFEIYVRPFPGSGGKRQVSAGSGAQPPWRHDGKELYYVAPDGRFLMNVFADEAIASPITVVLNWDAGLKK